MSGEGSQRNREVPPVNRPLKEGGPWGKHGFPHGSEAELAASVVGQSPATRPDHGASDAHDRTVRHDCHVMRRITSVIARPISGSAIGAPRETTTALETTPRLTIPS